MFDSCEERTRETLDAAIRSVGKARRKMLAMLAGWLLEMKRRRWFVGEFSSVADYAKARLGFSARKTRDLIELADKAARLPGLRDAFEESVIHWTKLREIAKVATADSEAEWIERARTLGSRELERAVAGEMGNEMPKIKVVFELTDEQLADLDDALKAFRRERNEAMPRELALLELVRRGVAGSAGSGRPPFQTVVYRCEDCEKVTRETREGPIAVEPATAGRAECDSEVTDARQPGRIARTIPPATRRYVRARDRDRCIVPGCSGRDFVEVHHVVPRAEGGDHKPVLLATLCTLCRLRHKVHYA